MASISRKLVGASPFLPDEIVDEILSKVTDLKTLCICKRVSKHFYNLVCEVDTTSFNAPPTWKTNDREFCKHVYSLPVSKLRGNNYYSRKVDGLINSMTKFTRLESLYIELPWSSFKGLPYLKWKAFIGSNRIDSLVFVSPTSIYNTKGSSYDNHEKKTYWFGVDIAWKCMEDAYVRYMMLYGFARECPFLEKISITDSLKRGRVSLSGAKLFKARKSSTKPPNVDEFRYKVSRGHIPLLDLPVSGFVMKEIELMLYEDVRLPSGYTYDCFSKIDDDEDDFEGKERAAYSEAVRKIFNDGFEGKLREGYNCCDLIWISH